MPRDYQDGIVDWRRGTSTRLLLNLILFLFFVLTSMQHRLFSFRRSKRDGERSKSTMKHRHRKEMRRRLPKPQPRRRRDGHLICFFSPLTSVQHPLFSLVNSQKTKSAATKEVSFLLDCSVSFCFSSRIPLTNVSNIVRF